MIAKLKGLIDSQGEDWVVVDVGGVGYLVACSSKTLARLQTGAAASLFIETHVREDAISLYGFLETGERDWFRLCQCQGGRQGGLAICRWPRQAVVQIIAARTRRG
jgi:Holliday junction DNA helicase RuvA